jgi:cytochrome c556
MKKLVMVIPGILAIALSAQVIAADNDPNLGLIKARQGDMQLRAYSAVPLFNMAKGKIPYDAAQATKLANNLKVLLQLDVGGAWAPGTGNDKYGDKTKALPEIWSTYPKIAETGKKYRAAVEELAAVAGNGLDALKSKIVALGDGCKGCHDDFRKKE